MAGQAGSVGARAGAEQRREKKERGERKRKEKENGKRKKKKEKEGRERGKRRERWRDSRRDHGAGRPRATSRARADEAIGKRSGVGNRALGTERDSGK